MHKLKERTFTVTKVVTYEPVKITIYGNSRRSAKAVAIVKAYGTQFDNSKIKFKIK